MKEALFSILNHKYPSPNGFSSGFYKSSWTVMEGIVIEAVLEFFKRGKLIKQVGHINLLLMPNIQSPKEAGDFRPIACCTVLYKCIPKMIWSRLREVLSFLVDGNQCAFILGREIVHNVMLCLQITRGYSRKSITPRCIMKVDLEKKVYDYVNHGFVEETLKGMKFPQKFINWVMVCLRSSYFSICMNSNMFL